MLIAIAFSAFELLNMGMLPCLCNLCNIKVIYFAILSPFTYYFVLTGKIVILFVQLSYIYCSILSYLSI